MFSIIIGFKQLHFIELFNQILIPKLFINFIINYNRINVFLLNLLKFEMFSNKTN